MRVLVDTNVLVRLADSRDTNHQVAVDAIRQLSKQQVSADTTLVVVPQVLAEFWVVATRSLAANGLGETPDYAQRCIAGFVRLFQLLRDERAIYERWHDLVVKYQFAGVPVFDTRLVASMIRHNVSHVLTFNPRHFRRDQEMSVIDPMSIVSRG